LEGLGLDGTIISHWITKKYGGRLRTGFSSSGQGPVVESYKHVNELPGSIKGRTFSLVPDPLLASQEGLCCMELVLCWLLPCTHRISKSGKELTIQQTKEIISSNITSLYLEYKFFW
jgi:hypothetical protein